MDIFSIFRRGTKSPSGNISAMAGGSDIFNGLDDPKLLEYIRGNSTDGSITTKQAMKNPAVFRCVSLISFAIGRLPLHVLNSSTKEKAKDHPLFKLLHSEPNNWQTAFNYRQLMQRRSLVNGNGYSFIVRSGQKVIRLVPLDPEKVTPRQKNDWSVEFVYRPNNGVERVLNPEDVLHIYADSDDGLVGTSMVQVASNAIELSNNAEMAASRLFKNGMLVGGALTHPQKLSEEAHKRLVASMESRFQGAENAHKWLVLEEGMSANTFSNTAQDSQQIETREHQVQEIGRAFGVPRPFLGVDDTSWGSGIDVLGQIFVRFALAPWFDAWEKALKRSLMTDREKDELDIKFNDAGLVRGSMKDQSEFFAKALGSGGHQPWMDYPEIRDIMDLPEKDIEPNPLANKVKPNEPA
jgi:HK97 family phage portal protein